MAGRCTRTFGIARNSDNSAAAATREGARLNSKARLSASVGGFLAVPLTQSLYKCRPSLIVAQRLLALSCYCEFAPRGRKRLRRAVQPDLTTAAAHLYLWELLLPPGHQLHRGNEVFPVVASVTVEKAVPTAFARGRLFGLQ